MTQTRKRFHQQAFQKVLITLMKNSIGWEVVMPDSVSELIYESFFEKLVGKDAVRPETIEMLRKLYISGRLASKNDLARLAQQMELKHAQNQRTNDQ